MIVNFSNNAFKRSIGVIYWNRVSLFYFSLFAIVAYIICIHYGFQEYTLPIIPVSILGGALAIFLGFRNSSAYDRWWEARKIWGSIVNDSRSFSMELITYGRSTAEGEAEMKAWTRASIRRHIGWIYALRSHLRKEKYCEELAKWVSKEELVALSKTSNKPAQMLLIQGKEIAYAFEKGWIEEFRFNALISTVKKLYDCQGKAERIKNTVFPFYYNYFTRFFLRLFTFCLPFTLAGVMTNWLLIPISVAIAFAFTILNKTGIITETPFEGRAADTPLTTICRGIEIDLLEMLGDSDIPKPTENKTGKFGVIYKA